MSARDRIRLTGSLSESPASAGLSYLGPARRDAGIWRWGADDDRELALFTRAAGGSQFFCLSVC
jgi:hypothetical protein